MTSLFRYSCFVKSKVFCALLLVVHASVCCLLQVPGFFNVFILLNSLLYFESESKLGVSIVWNFTLCKVFRSYNYENLKVKFKKCLRAMELPHKLVMNGLLSDQDTDPCFPHIT